MFLARAAKGGVNKPADCSAYRPRWRPAPHPTNAIGQGTATTKTERTPQA